MGRFLVMDVVFYGSSLNYDQGSGNYQELKKITRWDGRQYTFVSRYALRYSLLNDSGIFGQNELAPGTIFTKDSKEKTKGDVFNPKPENLFNGEILKYPEFDLFGYLVTKSEPTQSRTAPVRISHAISMTPFYYDSHFSGNHWIAQRALKAGLTKKLEPNLFTAEEHHAYYIYTVVVDVDSVGRFSVFTTKKEDVNSVKNMLKDTKTEENGTIVGKMNLNLPSGNNVEVDVRIISISKPEEEDKKGKKGKQSEPILYEIQYDLRDSVRYERIEKLVKAVLHLTRNIKGRREYLKPKLLVVGVYKDKPYDSFKNRIELVDEYIEEEYTEITEPQHEGDENKQVIKVRHVKVKTNKPKFRVLGVPEETKKYLKNEETQITRVPEIKENEILGIIKNGLFGNDTYPGKGAKSEDTNNEKDKETKISPEVFIFRDPSIEVELQ